MVGRVSAQNEIEDLRLDPDPLSTPLESPCFGVELIFSESEAHTRRSPAAYSMVSISQQAWRMEAGTPDQVQNRSRNDQERVKHLTRFAGRSRGADVAQGATTAARRQTVSFRMRGKQVMRNKRRSKKMKKATLTLGAGLILLTGWLLVPGIASAQALKTPIEGRWVSCFDLGEPEREWVDEDGIIHVRGQRYRCRHDGDIVGREDGVFGLDFDLDGGVRFARGTSSFTGTILGVNVSATGHWVNECTRPEGEEFLTCTQGDVWHLEDGRLFKLSTTYVSVGFPQPYTGILLDPPGLRLGVRQLRR